MSRSLRGILNFYGCKVRGSERIFLTFVVTPLVALTAAGIFHLFRNDPVQRNDMADNASQAPGSREMRLPLDPSVLIRKVEEAEALEKTGDFEKSQAAFVAITGTNPENDRAWGGLGRSLLAMGRYQEAAAALDRACHLQVIEARHFAARGAARRAMNDLKGSFQDLNDAQRLNPRDVRSSITLLFIAIELEDYDLFDRTMVRLRATSPASQSGWIVAEAAKEMRIGENHDARLLLQKASETLPPEEYESFLADRIFANKRCKDLIASLEPGVSP